MKILKIGSTPNPTVRFECPVCGSILECNYNELIPTRSTGGADFDCPICGLLRHTSTFYIINESLQINHGERIPGPYEQA